MLPQRTKRVVGALSLASMLCAPLQASNASDQHAEPGRICVSCFDFRSLGGEQVSRSWNHSVIRYAVKGDRASVAASGVRDLLAAITERTSISFEQADARYQLLLILDANAFGKVRTGDPGLPLPPDPRVASLLREMVGRAEDSSQDCTSVELDDASVSTQGAFLVANGTEPTCIEKYMKGIMGLRTLANSGDDLRNLCFLYEARRRTIRSKRALLEFEASNPQVCPTSINGS